MKFLRAVMLILAILHLALAALTGLVGAFADGGSIPERVLVSVVHPAAAVLLVVLVASSGPVKTWLRTLTPALLLAGIAADSLVAILIGRGVIKGDWTLPLVFTIVPVLGVAYILTSVGDKDG